MDTKKQPEAASVVISKYRLANNARPVKYIPHHKQG